jgi:hypothetical protein
MSTPDILAENLLSDEEHRSLDVHTIGLMRLLERFKEPELLGILILDILLVGQATQKANLHTLSLKEVQMILIDE